MEGSFVCDRAFVGAARKGVAEDGAGDGGVQSGVRPVFDRIRRRSLAHTPKPEPHHAATNLESWFNSLRISDGISSTCIALIMLVALTLTL